MDSFIESADWLLGFLGNKLKGDTLVRLRAAGGWGQVRAMRGVFSLVLLNQTMLRQERGWGYLWAGYGVNYQAQIQHGAAEIFPERITDSLCALVDLS